MFLHTADQAFRRYQRTGDPRALARVFDKTAGELLGLARHLGSGEAAAEDLVQATFVTALESAPSFDAERAVLPWLVGILANHARAARRKSRRALDPSRLPADVGLDPVDAAAGGELRTQVATAIEGLPEAQRPVLRLLLEHGLTPTEIARTLERPAATVRVQIHRGLALLRAALPAAVGARAALAGQVDGGHVAAGHVAAGQGAAGQGAAERPARGLDAVRAAVLVRCGEQVGSTVAAGGVSLGVLTAMNLKLISAVVLAAVLAVFAYQGFGGASVAPAPIADAAGAATLTVAPPSVPSIVAPAPEATRAPVPVAATASPSRSAASAGALRVSLSWATDGSPAVGVEVWLKPWGRMQDDRAASVRRRTDGEGMVEFAGLPTAQYVLHGDRAGGLRAFEFDAEVGALLEVSLPEGVDVEGVVHTARGTPVAGARVLGHGTALAPSELARTDSEGRYAIRDVGPGIELQARAAAHAPSASYRVAGEVGGRVVLDLALSGAGRRVAGRVVDADGRAAAAALVALLLDCPSLPAREGPQTRAAFVSADAEGRFVIDDVPTGACIVVAQPAGTGEATAGRELLPEGTSDAFVDLRLRRGASLSGTVTDRGKALVGARIIAWAERPTDDLGYLLNLIGMRQVTTDAGGRYQLTGLVPGDYQISVTREAKLTEARLALDEGQVETLDLRCGEGLALDVTVDPARPPAGVGLPVWMVQISRRHADGNLEYVNMAPGQKGRVRFTNLEAGDYVVQVGCQLVLGSSSYLLIAGQDVRVPHAEPLAIELPAVSLPAVYTTGRLVDAHGEPVPNLAVTVSRRHERLVGVVEVRSGEDGRFRVGPLPAGEYSASIALGVGGRHPLRELRVEATDLDLGDFTVPSR